MIGFEQTISSHSLDYPVPENLPTRRIKAATWFDTADLIEAGRLPKHVLPWLSKKGKMNAFEYQGRAILADAFSMCSMHKVSHEGYGGYTVMSDDVKELERHLEAVRQARGDVLKTGLGFGCFVRMALLNPYLRHIDIVEQDAEIASHFGAQFIGDDRVTIHVADAFEFPTCGRRWDFAWHDIYCEGNNGLQVLHVKLIQRFATACDLQGAWKLEPWIRQSLRRAGMAVI